MVDLDTEICVCNGVTVQEMAECVKENNLKTLKEMTSVLSVINVKLATMKVLIMMA